MTYKLLIADDNKKSFEYVQKILSDELDRFKFVQASRDSIYKLAIKENPNLILVNIDNLSRKGVESIMSLKQDKITQGIPVIVFSTVEDVHEARPQRTQHLPRCSVF